MRTVFHFDSKGMEPETLKVFRFDGDEGISRLYRFQVDLLADDDSLDLEAILNSQASIGFERDGATVNFHGMLCSFEQLGQTAYSTHYRAVLVPRLWLLTQRRRNRIYQEMTVQDIVTEKLKDAELSTDDFEFRLAHQYEPLEYVVQYRETDLDFAARLMEHEGIFYFFEQRNDREKLIIGDSNVAFDEIPQANPIQFRTPAGMESAGGESVQALICRQQRIAKNVTLKEYNYRNPSMYLKAENPKPNDKTLGGLASDYGDHFKDEADGDRLARIRAEELLAQERVFLGESDCAAFRCGNLFGLADHYRADFDQPYILTGVRHTGWQSSPGIEGLKAGEIPENMKPDAEGTAYRNEFTSIPGSVTFRPERTTPKPKLHGVMNAHIDAAGSGEYAELDEEGRYKVIVTFDLSGIGDGKATRYIRMAQPYAGPGYGFHAPLHKGTEVIWTCVDGDLDRPIIVGAVPNPQTKSPVTKANQTQSVLRTAAQNQLVMEDRGGAELITVQTPYDSSTLFLGAEASGAGIIATTEGHGIVHAKKGIYLNAWPSEYWGTGDLTNYINAGISASQFVVAAADALGVGDTTFLTTLTGVSASITSLSSPSITLSAPAGISATTPSTFTGIGMAGVGLLTAAAANIIGGANVSLMSGGGVKIYTVTGGVSMVSSRGDIDIEAKSADVKVRAKANVRASADDSIAVKARQQVAITAEESNIVLVANDSDVDVIAMKKIQLTAEEEKIALLCGEGSLSILKEGEGAEEEIILQCGKATIRMCKSGKIVIGGELVVLESKAASLRLEDDKYVLETEKAGNIKGGSLEVTAENTHTIKGKLIKINP